MKAKMQALGKELKEASDNYYVKSNSVISDQEFDGKLKELAALEKANPDLADSNSLTKRVGSDLTSGFKKVTHEIPMMSIDNVFNWDDFQEFRDSIKKELGYDPDYTIEFKCDGLSLGVIYDHGIMESATTRGDCVVGDDVTENAKTIADIPLTVNYQGRLEVRGEVMLSKPQFEVINAFNAENGLKEYKNPRNAASGMLKSKDPKEVARKKLNFSAFDIVQGSDGIKNQLDVVEYLKQMKFPNINNAMPLPIDVINSDVKFDELTNKLNAMREQLPYEMDGLVIKVSDKDIRASMGKTAKHVRWARAFKFEAEQAFPVIESITYQVGRTGRITPVAHFEGVPLGGTTVKKATLHNFEEMERLGIQLGDTVVLEKGGEIIPKVVDVLEDKRDASCYAVVLPTACPCCGEPIEKGKDVDVFCNNTECPDRLSKAIEWFVSRKCMNMQSIGPSVIGKLLKAGALSEPLDLFSLQPIHFEDIDGMGAKSVGKIFDSIDKAKTAPAHKLLAGLGLRHVGVGTAGRVMAVYDSFDKIAGATVEQIMAIPDVGETVATSIVQYFESNPGLLLELKELGLRTADVQDTSNDFFKDQVVVVTGSLETMDREDAHNTVRLGGGRTTGSVSGKTTLLVVGENAGSKLTKAEKLGIRILTEVEFIKVAAEGGLEA